MSKRENPNWAWGVHGANGRLATCSFCGASVQWQRYADHLSKVHPGGRVAPLRLPTTSMVALLATGGVTVCDAEQES